jgi:hypothetical protein
VITRTDSSYSMLGIACGDSMPFRYLSDFAKEDASVKLLFDHVRNIGIVAVVATGAAWKYTRAHPSGWQHVFDLGLAFALGVFAFALFFIIITTSISCIDCAPVAFKDLESASCVVLRAHGHCLTQLPVEEHQCLTNKIEAT